MASILKTGRSIGMLLFPLLFFFFYSSVHSYAQNIKITGFSPTAAKAGDIVTIYGLGFNSTPANNTVFFGNKKANLLSASSFSLAAQVPAGADFDNITVTNTVSGFTTSSATRFAPFITPPKANIIARDFEYIYQPDGLLSGTMTDFVMMDVDRDGKPDLISLSTDGNYPQVIIRQNTSTTTSVSFANVAKIINTMAYGSPTALTTGDFNLDGYRDLAVGIANTRNVLIILNTGNISMMQVDAAIDAGIPVANLTVADMNLDNTTDIVVGDGSSNVSILQNNSSGGYVSFIPYIKYLSSNSKRLYIQDLDQDGIPDIAGIAPLNPYIFVHKGTIDNFTRNYSIGAFSTSYFSGVASDLLFYDFDNNGTLDVAVSTPGSIEFRSVTPAANGFFNFTPNTTIPVSGNPSRLSLASMRGDKRPDLLVSFSDNTFGTTGYKAGLLLNKSTETAIKFGDETLFPAAAIPIANYITDLNLDNKPDFIVGSSTNHGFSIYQNKISLPPVIKSISPTGGPASANMQILANNFSATAENNKVTIGGIPATVTGVGTDRIFANIPPGTAIGPVNLYVTDNGLQANSSRYFSQSIDPSRSTLTRADLQHTPATDIALSFKPNYVSSADFDGDGRPDLLASNNGAGATGLNFQFYKNTSSNNSLSFSPTIAQPISNTTYSYAGQPAIADFDGDGRQDVVFPCDNGTNTDIIVYSNTGSISNWSLYGSFPIFTKAEFADAADIDGDGLIDVFTASHSTGNISIMRNISAKTRSFSFKNVYTGNPTASPQQFSKLVDIDGDNRPDIISANVTRGGFYILLNSSTPGNINFGSPILTSDGSTPIGIHVADVNGDGQLDVLAYYPDHVDTYLNYSTPGRLNLQSSTAITLPHSINKVCIGDINGDGYPELIAGSGQAPFMSAYANSSPTGTNGFNAAGIDLNDLGDQPSMMITGDFNRDGRTDVVAAVANSSVLKTYLANIVVPPTLQAKDISITNKTNTSSTISWTNGDGEKRAVFLYAGNTDTPAPIEGQEYTANAAFKSGDQIGTSGWYCVYNGTGSSVNVTGLNKNTAYKVMVTEYNTGGITGNAAYLTATVSTNPAAFDLLSPDLSCDYANMQTTAINSLCIGCSVTNSNAAIDTDSTSYSTISIQPGQLGGYAEQNLIFNSAGTSTDTVLLKIQILNYASISDLAPIQIASYLGSNYNNDRVSLTNSQSNLVINVINNIAYVKFAPKTPFDNISIRLNSGNSAITNIYLYYATRMAGAPVVTTAPASTCSATPITLTASSPNATIKWYDAATNGNLLAIGNDYTTGNITSQQVYYAEATRTSNGCVNPSRTAVTVDIITSPVITANPSGSTITVSGNTNFSVTASGNGTLSYTWQVDKGQGFINITDGGEISGATTPIVSITGATTNMNGWKFRPVVTNSCNLSATGNEATLTVNKRSQTITFTSQTPNTTVIATYGDAPVSAAATATSGNAVIYTSSNPAVASIDNNGLITINGAGIVTITAAQSGDLIWQPAAPISFSLNINKKTLTITADMGTKVYGTNDPILTYTASGLAGNDVISGSLTRQDGENTGNYTISPGTLYAGANYNITFIGNTFTITPAMLTITADAKTKVYGSNDPALSYTTSGLINNDPISGSLSRNTGENVGSYSITKGSLDAGNNYSIIFNGSNFDISAATLTVMADAKTKVYGTSDPALTYQISGLVNNDPVTGSLNRDAGEDAGDYDITQGSLSAGNNYNIHFYSNKLSISPASLIINADAQSKVYGSSDPALTYTTTGLVNHDPITGILTRIAGENTGTYGITQGSVSAGNNYSITFNSNNLTITPAPLTITADAKSKVYGTSDPALTYTTSGLINNDPVSGLLSRITGENVGSYSITKGSLDAGNNYSIIFHGNNLDISAATLTVTADAKTKVYGTSDPALTYQTSGLLNNDPLTGSLSRNIGENAGDYDITQGSLSAGNNYNIHFNSNKLSISPASLIINADAQSKVYGSSDPALTYTATGLINHDPVTGLLTRIAGENTGTYGITQGSVSAGNNYSISFNSNNLTITPAPLTITADAKSKVYGSSDPALTYSTSGLLNNDPISGSLSRNTGENIGSYNITKGSLDAGNNYRIIFNSNNLEISAATLTVTADAKTKVYGTSDPALTYTASGLLNSDKLSGALSRNTGENVGGYAITQGSLSAGNNYTITFNPRNLSITPAALSINADAKSKTYGTTDPALTYTTTGLVAGDQLSGKLSRDAGENAGTYPITQGTLNAGNNYTATFNGNTFTINKAPQTINWAQTLALGCDGNTSILLTASSSSGLPVSYSINNSMLATINGSTLTATGSGSGIVSAAQAGDNNYEAAPVVSNNLNILLPSMVRQHWNDVLMFDNSANNFLKWQWYKNNAAVTGAVSQYFSESGALNGTYYVIATDKNGNQIQSCPISVNAATPASGGIMVSPNPVAKGATATVTSRYTDTQLNGAMLIISDITGKTIAQYKTVLPVMQVKMPVNGGFYIITLLFANGQKATTNVIVN